MAKPGVNSASSRTEPHSAQAANSRPKPNDGFVEPRVFIAGRGTFSAKATGLAEREEKKAAV